MEKNKFQNKEFEQIEGRNPILEVLKTDRNINKILIQQDDSSGILKKIIAIAKDKGIITQNVNRKKLDNISISHAHQGVIALASPYSYVDVQDILNLASEKGEDPFVIILDQINDPHNFGAIIRTANACGAHGVIIPKRRSVGITPIVTKASAGAIEHTFVAAVANLTQTIKQLKEKSIWIAGADLKGEKYHKSNLTGPMGLVIGSEGKGISRLVKEQCDFLVNIPMIGEVQSLNASVASAVLMYEVIRQRELQAHSR